MSQGELSSLSYSSILSIYHILLPSQGELSSPNISSQSLKSFTISKHSHHLQIHQEIEGQIEADRKLQEKLILEDFGPSTAGRVRFCHHRELKKVVTVTVTVTVILTMMVTVTLNVMMVMNEGNDDIFR